MQESGSSVHRRVEGREPRTAARWNTVEGLRQFGPDAAEAIPPLIGWLTSGKDKKGTHEETDAERGGLCLVLAAIGPKDERVLAAFRKTLKNREEVKEVRAAAADGIIRVGKGQEALPDLFGMLDETSGKKKELRTKEVRRRVLESIGELKLEKKDVEALSPSRLTRRRISTMFVRKPSGRLATRLPSPSFVGRACCKCFRGCEAA